MMVLRRLSLVVAMCVLGWCATATADDFEDAVQAASQAYAARHYSQAKESLEKAVTAVNHKRSIEMMPLFPKAPEGWDASAPEISEPPFGGESVSSTYTKGDASIKVSIDRKSVTSMAFAMMMPMLQNPAFSEEKRQELMKRSHIITFGTFYAMSKADDKDGSVQITVRVSSTVTVVFKGKGVTMEQVQALAGHTDFSRMFVWFTQGRMGTGVTGKPKSPAEDVVGTWKGEVQGKTTGFTFGKDMSVSWSIPLQNKTASITGRYLVDYTKDPITIDLVDLAMVGKPVLAIARFTDNGDMLFNCGSPTGKGDVRRPDTFEGAIRLSRAKQP